MNPLTAPTVSTVSTPSTALRPLLRLTALAAATVLAACGGGGGGGSTPAPAPAPAPALPPADLSVAAALVATGYPDLMGNQRPQAIVGDTTVQVRFTAGNAGPTAVTGALFRLDAVAGFTPSAIACANATGGATCPVNLTPQGVAGGVLVDLPSGAGMAFTVTGTVSQTGSIAPRATVVAPGSVTDSNTANNGAQMAITVNPIAPSTLVTSVPAPTYAAGSQQLAAFNYLNGIRGRCGFGLLKQDTRLDQAADDHANYLALNFAAIGADPHSQSIALPGFTGNTTTDRARVRGYPLGTAGQSAAGSVGEGVSRALGMLSIAQALPLLTQSTYHALGTLSDVLDIGLGGRFLSGNSAVVAKYGIQSQAQPQRLAGDAVALYPCDGETDTLRVHPAESPDPMPGFAFGSYGAPLIAKVRDDQSLTIDSWTIAPVGGATLPATLRAKGFDPNNSMPLNFAALIPNTVLAANTTYNVVLRGKTSGIPFERRYSFTTGAN